MPIFSFLCMLIHVYYSMKTITAIISVFFFFLSCFLSGCSSKPDSPTVYSIVDFSGDSTCVLNFGYDTNRRIIRIGHTPVSYEKKKVVVGEMNNIPGYGNLFGVVFHMKNNRVVSSQASCVEIIKGRWVKVDKKSSYTYSDDTITIESSSYEPGTKFLLKTNIQIYSFLPDGRISEIDFEDTDFGRRKAIMEYKNNLKCLNNLNLQVYSMPLNGLDDYLSLLLNLMDLPELNALPDIVHFSDPVAGEEKVFQNYYRMDGEVLSRMEVMEDYENLISRVEFFYKDSIR